EPFHRTPRQCAGRTPARSVLPRTPCCPCERPLRISVPRTWRTASRTGGISGTPRSWRRSSVGRRLRQRGQLDAEDRQHERVVRLDDALQAIALDLQILDRAAAL